MRDYLVVEGIASNRLVANGYGEAYPVTSSPAAAEPAVLRSRNASAKVRTVLLGFS